MNRFALEQYREKNVHIIGASGAEGFAVLDYLYEQGFTHLIAHDMNTGDSLRSSFMLSHVSWNASNREAAFDRFINMPVIYRLGDAYLSDIESADLAFAGQNWFAHARNQPLADARTKGLRVAFLINMYFGLSPAPIAAVTGTNGKTTVSSLLFHLLQETGIPALMSGNDRYHPQVLNQITTLPETGVLVLEVSNRQLRELDGHPHYAVLTNVQPDHIEEHGSFEAYAAVKERLFMLQSSGDYAIVNLDDPIGNRILSRCPGIPVPFSTRKLPETGGGPLGDGYGIRWNGHETMLFRAADLKIPGEHNIANALAAMIIAYLVGCSPDTLNQALTRFPGVRNRIQFITAIDGVNYYDDLASTNPTATEAALRALNAPVILICGGQQKGNRESYHLLQPVIQQKVKCLITLPGNAGDSISAISGQIPVERVMDLDTALNVVKKYAFPGDSVVLSPAGAGFYTSFVAGSRGFRRLIREIRRDLESTQSAE